RASACRLPRRAAGRSRRARGRGGDLRRAHARRRAQGERARLPRRRRARGRGECLMPVTPVLTKRWSLPESWTLATYERTDGYRALRKALAMRPDEIIAIIKDASLRGRGGAGFPAG